MRRKDPLGLFVGLVVLLASCLWQTQAALALSNPSGKDSPQGRLALVVGNSNYRNIPSLKNPFNDAALIAETLRKLGFDVVEHTDVTHEQFKAAVEEASSKSRNYQTVLFYFAGHGFQLGGQNYLVPVDARLTDRNKTREETLLLDEIILKLQSRDRQTLILLDACRNNPLPQSVRGKDASQGLAQVETGSGTFIAFATQPGNVTLDGAGVNSPFSIALAEHMRSEGISISDMMIRVRNSVEERTLRKQTPWDQSSLRSQFYFNPSVEVGDALTEDDIALLRNLEPELREKFARRFGLDLDLVEAALADDGDGSQVTIALAAPDEEPASVIDGARAQDPFARSTRPEPPSRPAAPALRIEPAIRIEAAEPPAASDQDDAASSGAPDAVERPEQDARASDRQNNAAGSEPVEAAAEPEPTLPERKGPSLQVLAAPELPAPSAVEAKPAAPASTPAPAARAAAAPKSDRDAPPASPSATVPFEPALRPAPTEPTVATTPAAPIPESGPSIAQAAQPVAPGSAIVPVPTVVAPTAPVTEIELPDGLDEDEKEIVLAGLPDASAERPLLFDPPAASERASIDADGSDEEVVPEDAAQDEVTFPTAVPVPDWRPEEEMPTTVAALDQPALQYPIAPSFPADEPAVEAAPEAEVPLPRVDPDYAEPAPDDEPLPDPRELAVRAQEELQRLGCYRSAVDGDWGPLSRRALLRFYAEQKLDPDETEPTPGLVARLEDVDTVVCKTTVREDRKAPEAAQPRRTPRADPKPVAKPKPKAEPRVASKPKPAPKAASKPAAKPQIKKPIIIGGFN